MRNQTLKSKVRATLAAISAICFLTPNAVRADNSKYFYDIARQLVRAAITSGLRGYTSTHKPFKDPLAHRCSNNITIKLRTNTSYAIVGVCDRDYRDVDITLYDRAGNRIASDFKNDDTPFIRINPNRSGAYRIRVSMANCKTNFCYYGVGAFGR